MIRAVALLLAAWATLGSINPDAAGIEQLRQHDVAATLTQNPDDRGRFEATFQGAHDSAASVLHGRFLRVMKKQRDGSWRYTRIMWQEDKA
jgi:hypothetical protein